MVPFDGSTALVQQQKLRNIEIIQFLLEHGADPNVKVNYGLTPLMIATEEGKYETDKWLIEHGANIDNHELFGNVPLHFAVSYGHKRILKLLIENGVSID